MELLRSRINLSAIIITVAICCLVSCVPAKKASIQSQKISGISMKTSGFYYYKFKDGNYSLKFIYENGTVLTLAGSSKFQNSIKNVADEIIEAWKESKYQNNKYLWGAIYFHDTYFKIHQWQAAGLAPDYVKTISGLVLNDTTFTVMKIAGNRLEEPRTYHFQFYSPKPDSTNQFIEVDSH